ncbi:MAG: beta-ketoacyl synthase N-terminal-like domain-containing protein, partial [Giesbergeria sp.]
LADAAELAAVNEVFGQAERTEPCFVGTVKANIGHLESASGLSQLSKVLLQLQHGQLAPTLRSEPRNPLIELDPSRLAVVTQPTPWPAGMSGRPRRALIHSIGAAGSAAHLIVAEYPPQPRVPQPEGSEVVPLSAATAEQLHLQMQLLQDFLTEQADSRLGDIAFTLRVGRVALRERLALVSSSTAELRQQLQALLAQGAVAGAYRGTAPDRLVASALVQGAEPQLLAAAWVQGSPVDWSALQRPGQRRMPLPTYPFEAVRHWLDGSQSRGTAMQPALAAAAQPADDCGPLPGLEEGTHAFLVRQLAEATGIPARRISLDGPLEALGLNSMIIEALNARMAQGLPELPRTVFFEHRTLRSLADYLMREQRAALKVLLGLSGPAPRQAAPVAGRAMAAQPQPQSQSQSQSQSANVDQPIAIVGLAGRYPQAETLDLLWHNLAAGKDCIEQVPPERWDLQRGIVVDGPTQPSHWGGFLRDVDAFDPLFFNISPLEAERMDPQERLVLQTAWQTFEDAGYSRAALDAACQGRVGVFIGVMYSEYQLLPRVEQALGISGSYGTIANRVSYTLNLSGPSMAIDTMCSSSLTALHLACESIRRGDCACALAGGVNLSLHPNKYVTHALLNMPSSDGRCHSFGADGDGFVPSEGVGMVLLKPLDRALADGDQIHGVIRSTAVNHGGKTNGYTVPNPAAHQALIRDALARAGISARSISYVEAHGTGTTLGDPIEIAGLSRAFGEHTADRQFCAIGSVKSNIGHAEGAAGIAGLTKVLLQMRHGQLVPSLHCRQPNPNIDFSRTPFVLQHALVPWHRPVVEVDGVPRELARTAGISSFGAGGANAHVIVEEYRPAEPAQPCGLRPGQPALVVLSARNQEQLHERVRQLLAALEQGAVTDDNLADAAYTLQVGRDAMQVRLAFPAPSTGALRERLQ